jgi:5-oxoprolinase (ATP-hydrolysing) subunit A
MAQIDLNSDLAELAGHDDEILELVTTANVCCAFHAGHPSVSMAIIHKAMRLNVRVGVHPGYADRKNFGRLVKQMRPGRLFSELVYQVGALKALAGCWGATLKHLKPHGGMYHQACAEADVAKVITDVAEIFQLAVLALPNSVIEQKCAGRVRFIREGFADRRYHPDGSLVPRSEPNAFVEDADEAVDQAERLIAEQNIRSLCVHGDNPQAVEFVRKLREQLTKRGHEIVPFT